MFTLLEGTNSENGKIHCKTIKFYKMQNVLPYREIKKMQNVLLFPYLVIHSAFCKI